MRHAEDPAALDIEGAPRAAQQSPHDPRRPLVGITSDLRARLPLYASDWGPCTLTAVQKIVAASLFSYICSVLPALIFGDILNRNTHGEIGIPEVLISTGLSGVLWSIFAGQGLVVVGVTGPVMIFTTVINGLSDRVGAPFVPWMGWVCVWSGLMHICLACAGAVELVKKVTSFSGEVFGLVISVAYVYDAVEQFFPLGARGEAWELVLAIGTFSVAAALHHARASPLLTERIRAGLSMYGALIAITLLTGVSYLPDVVATHLKRLTVPPAPSFAPSSGRPWPNDLMACSGPAIAAALGPAAMLTLLFFFDHNVSSILAQSPRFNLRKPPAFHWDFAVLGAIVLLQGLFGLPPGNGLIPQAPLHVRALATIVAGRDDDDDDDCPDLAPQPPPAKRSAVAPATATPAAARAARAAVRAASGGETIIGVVEMRWSNLFQSALCVASVGLYAPLGMIPQGVLQGIFIYMGVSALYTNDLHTRAWLLITQPDLRPAHLPYVRDVRWSKIAAYTWIQLGWAAAVFILAKRAPPAYAVTFPLSIAMLIPLRAKLLPRLFDDADLQSLDAPTLAPSRANAEPSTRGAARRRDANEISDVRVSPTPPTSEYYESPTTPPSTPPPPSEKSPLQPCSPSAGPLLQQGRASDAPASPAAHTTKGHGRSRSDGFSPALIGSRSPLVESAHVDGDATSPPGSSPQSPAGAPRSPAAGAARIHHRQLSPSAYPGGMHRARSYSMLASRDSDVESSGPATASKFAELYL